MCEKWILHEIYISLPPVGKYMTLRAGDCRTCISSTLFGYSVHIMGRKPATCSPRSVSDQAGPVGRMGKIRYANGRAQYSTVKRENAMVEDLREM